jgi:hypothetical protein
MTKQNELDQAIEQIDTADIVWGAAAIAKLINRGDDVRRTYYLLEKGHLPAKKLGRVWVSSRKALRRAVTVTA